MKSGTHFKFLLDAHLVGSAPLGPVVNDALDVSQHHCN